MRQVFDILESRCLLASLSLLPDAAVVRAGDVEQISVQVDSLPAFSPGMVIQ
jgi:hypothetical protein